MPAPIGTEVVAKVGGEVKGTLTTVQTGAYGDVDNIQIDDLTVSDDLEDGDTIHFWVNGLDTGQTAEFSSGGDTKLNLTVEDNVAPVVTIDSVTTPTNVDTQTITGAFDEAFIDTIVVNGVGASIDEDAGTYSADVPLDEGTNEITVEATDLVGNAGTATATIEFVPPNRPPTADANGPYSVNEEETVALDGTGSSDPDGDTLTHSWSIADDPTGEASLTDTDTSTPVFRAPSIESDTNVIVELTVGDGHGHTDSDTATVTILALPPAPPAKVVENMTPENAAENLAASDPVSAAGTLENVAVENAARIVDAGVKAGLTDEMAAILDETDTESAANLLLAIYDLPETPEAAAELLGAMSLDKGTAVVQSFIARAWFEYVDGTFTHLSDENINDIYEGLTVEQRGELYPELSQSVKERISAELAPRFEVSNLEISKPEVETGETTTISVDVTNTGGTPYTYTAELSVENELVDSENVALDPDESGTVSFDVSREEAGTYDFSVDGLTGSFEVEKPPKPFPWPTVTAIIVVIIAVVAIAAWYWMQRRGGGI
ncbi:hypothetical protein AKJ58_01510 [candidate division MSBL1 archaeon SCGC-AAA385D11]|uniref:CARDB domain-containing protein n=1 Tax=candidate division MSBL1 archaeon SCGC-AAA385D11 TaxID=1698286 RepID=A0A133VN83_9EURY|nr:hypothetical protein AKJ58_01510 [candidate division MSBL1 archaeon SCGC-AAA385D11]